MRPKVVISLVNYRGADDTRRCLSSLKRLQYPHFHVVVVDNGSPDDSLETLKALKKNHAFYLIESRQNLGFSGANNLAIQYAQDLKADYVWLLNNDATVDAEALNYLVAMSEETGGLVGSLILNPDGSYQQTATAINWWTGRTRGIPESQVTDGMTVTALSGASMLIPMKVIREIGLMDPHYFLYCEDVAYCLAARKKGYPLTVATSSRVFHKLGASVGQKSDLAQYYYQRNRLKALMGYANWLQRLTISVYTGFRLVRSIIRALIGDGKKHRETMIHWMATFDYLQNRFGQCSHRF